MSNVQAQILIHAEPGRVWETVMDPSMLARWVTIHRSVKVRSEHPDQEGARMDQVLHLLGVSFKVHWTLEHVSPTREAEWHGRGPALSRALIRYRLTPVEEGTQFDYVNEFHTPGGPFGNAASRVLVGNLPQREAHESLLRLKALVEDEFHGVD
ncbi:MAG: SRPBCC family protein [Solirubrobacteraceae bacterium]